ncbi:TetR/AcrR family transcriptional regulator [Sulfoacidibacillus thermotolerans]|uniref:TetR family transcriptional regulator n=1 Tax=Sulfoacidibacillus thermotolerans TaxID=1765684 RepID=A0A2U3DAP4_SULT2|nr:TetR/AcrR family transcriptional regulator [Sulfoacidibacillus thermotolerans]PWI58354.1 TetR family transcriptional regulator [Sulfoacidibacillus thermotolerans]
MSAIAQRKDAAKYHAILEAAIKVMAVSGYHGAQVARIAREAGVADGTVYLYFKNKEDILVSVLRETISQIIMLSTWLEGDHPEPLLALHKLIEGHFTTLGRNPDLALVLQVHVRQSDPAIREQVADMMRPYHRMLERILVLGQETGVFRQPFDVRIARRMIFGTIDETVNAWIFTGAKYDLAAQTDPVYDMLLRGIGKGDKLSEI